MAGDFIKVFAPSTVSNVTCAFDILGFPLEHSGDELSLRIIKKKEIRIKNIGEFNIPLEPDKNVAGVVAQKMISKLKLDFGFEIMIKKGIKPGSGIGSSAASSACVVFGINELLDKPFKSNELVEIAMEGERLASGVRHADNVAPALLGSFILIRSYDPLDLIRIPSPPELFCTLIHPHIQIKTEDARKILKKQIPLTKAVQQWGNIAGLITGIIRSDYELIGRSMSDVVIEPVRSILIPGFGEIRETALEAGALGCGISGSGPSVFALSKGQETACNVKHEMTRVYRQFHDIPFDIFISNINPKGTIVLERS
jgi:homoserine kinase